MMGNRRIRVGLEIEGRLHIYEGLKMAVSGQKFADPLQGECKVAITGLNSETRNYILTQAKPTNQTPARVIVEAGRVGGDLFQVYSGDIIGAEVSLPPDVELVMKCKTNNANNAKIVVSHGKDAQQLSALANEVAAANGVGLTFEAQDKTIGNFSFTGTASKLVEELAKVGNVSVFIDDGVLHVTDSDKPVAGRRRILNERSGMVGLPRAKDNGCEVTFLVDGEAPLGGQLTIESRFNPSLNGDYIIEQLRFDLRTHSDEFYYIATCGRI